MGIRTSQTTGVAQTGPAPSLTTDGVDLTGATGLRVFAKGEGGGNLTGGSLLCWYYDAVEGWIRNPNLDLTVAVGPNAKQVWPDQPIAVPIGRVFFQPSAVTLSAGTTVAIRVDVFGYQVQA